MSVRSGQSITALFTTRVFATGVGTNADTTPTGTLYVNGTSNAASVTVTNISTGLYKAGVTLPTLAFGDEVELLIAATVSSISDSAVIWGDTKDIALDSSGDVTFNNTTIATATTVTNQLTAAQIATGVWQDTTSGDFTTASSIGKCLYIANVIPGAAGGHFIAGTNAATTITTSLTTTFTGNLTGNVGGSVASVASGGISNASFTADSGQKTVRSNQATAGSGTTITLDVGASATDNYYNNDLIYLTGGVGIGQAQFITGYVGSTKVATVTGWITHPDNTTTFAILPFDAIPGATAPTASQVATAVWTDTTSSDFTTAGSPGKILQTQLGSAFTTTSSSVFTTAALANAPNGTSAPTVGQIATAVWQDLLSSSDFTTAGSVGKAVASSLGMGGVTVAGYADGEDPATLVLGASQGDWTTPGTVGFQISLLGAAMVTVASGVANNGNFSVVMGTDYFRVDGPLGTLQFNQGSAQWPDLTFATACTLTIFGRNNTTFTAPMIFVTRGGTSQAVGVELTHAQTTAMTSGPFKAVVTLQDGHLMELFRGSCSATQT